MHHCKTGVAVQVIAKQKVAHDNVRCRTDDVFSARQSGVGFLIINRVLETSLPLNFLGINMCNSQGKSNGNGNDDGRKKGIMGDKPVDPAVKPPKPIGDDEADSGSDKKSPK